MNASKRIGRVVATLILLGALAAPAAVQARDLTTERPALRHLQLGTRNGKLEFIPNHLDLRTGHLYKLVLHNASRVEHEFDSPDLMERVFHSKVEIDGRHGRPAVTVTGRVDEIQLKPGQTVAWYFVPVRTTDKPVDFVCGLPGHEEAGMKGTVTIR